MRAFTGPFLLPILFPLVSVLHRDAKGRISWPESTPHHPTASLHFPFVSLSIFSLSFFFPTSVSFCQLYNTAPSCLHIARSKTTKWSFSSLQPSLSFFLISPFCLPTCAFSPFAYGPHDFSVSIQKKMLLIERKWNDTLKTVLFGR